MAFRVELTPRAESELNEIYAWVAERAPLRGRSWFDRFEGAILSLSDLAERCPVVPHLSTLEVTVRMLVCGRRRNSYLVFYTILEDVVWILHVRHGARSKATAKDLNQ